jgi:hypothetical protein
MDPQRPQPGVTQSESSRMAAASANTPLAETQVQCRHQLGNRDSSIAATENMAPDTHLQKVRKTGCSNSKQQHAIGFE